MSQATGEPRFTWGDVEQLVQEGIITPEQAAHLHERVASPPTLTVSTAPQPTPAAAPSAVKLLDSASVAYYFGGFLTLFAFIYFIVMKWSSFGEVGQFLVSLVSLVVVGGIGLLLRRSGFVLAGNILIFVATAIVPWLGYNFFRMVGLWPPSPADYQGYAAYEMMIRTRWIALEVISLVAALAAVWLTRFPHITVLITFWSWYLSIDVTRLFSQSTWSDYGKPEQLVSIIYGLAMLGIGMFIQPRTDPESSEWFYRAGHLAILINAILFIYNTDVAVGLMFLPLYFAFLVASVWLQRRIFLSFGALNFYVYIAYLTYQTFYSSPNFSLVMAVVGLLVIVSTAFYQRYVQPWIKTHMREYGEVGLQAFSPSCLNN